MNDRHCEYPPQLLCCGGYSIDSVPTWMNHADNTGGILYSSLERAEPEQNKRTIPLVCKADGTVREFKVSIGTLTDAERQILVDGYLINYYRK